MDIDVYWTKSSTDRDARIHWALERLLQFSPGTLLLFSLALRFAEVGEFGVNLVHAFQRPAQARLNRRKAPHWSSGCFIFRTDHDHVNDVCALTAPQAPRSRDV